MYGSISIRPTVSGCTFVGNIGDEGGAMANGNGAAPKITECVFHDNSANTQGGAIFHDATEDSDLLAVVDCDFYNNSAGNYGGARYDQFLWMA